LPVKQVIIGSTAMLRQETINVSLTKKRSNLVIIDLPTTTLMPFSLASTRVLFFPASMHEKEQISSK